MKNENCNAKNVIDFINDNENDESLKNTYTIIAKKNENKIRNITLSFSVDSIKQKFFNAIYAFSIKNEKKDFFNIAYKISQFNQFEINVIIIDIATCGFIFSILQKAKKNAMRGLKLS